MMRNLFYKICILVVASMFSINGKGQQPLYSAKLPPINIDSFYNIALPPLIVAKCLPGLADLRIRDKSGKVVPYYKHNLPPVFKESTFKELPIIQSARGADKLTHVTISNPTGELLNSLILEIKNTSANRLVTLSGSNDNKNYYVISEYIFLENVVGEKGTSLQRLFFPPSRYRFFRITILGEKVLPINITRVGINTDNFVSGDYEVIPAPVIQQKDSTDKNSYVTLNFSEAYQVDKLSLEITGPKFFNRSVEVRDAMDKYAEPFRFTIAPGNISDLPVRYKTNRLLLVVHNQDNPPLEIATATAFQLSTSVIAYLENEKDYTLLFGDKNASTPVYDISGFANSATGSAVNISPGEIEVLSILEDKKETKSYFSETVLWVSIIAVLLVLLFVTFNLTKQVNKSDIKP